LRPQGLGRPRRAIAADIPRTWNATIVRSDCVLGFQRLAAYARIKYEAYDCL
jgi:hypothetical protein